MKYENTFKAIDQILWKEQGCGSELDYLEQKSWMLFLKYLDDLETEREDEAEFVDQKLFPYLKDFQNTAASTDTLEYKIILFPYSGGEMRMVLRHRECEAYRGLQDL